MTQEETEGRLLAQRRLLAQIVALLSTRPENAAALQALLDRRGEYTDGSEDPGAETSAEFAIQAATADEFRRIADAAARLGAPG